jgi:membrane glycosyltransferase
MVTLSPRRTNGTHPAEEPVAKDRWPILPPEAPLDMPIQSLRSGIRVARRAASPQTFRLRRMALSGGTLLMTAFGAYEMHLVLRVAGLTIPEWVVMVLFVVLFAWVAFAFLTNLAGFLSMLSGTWRDRGPRESSPLPPLKERTALLFPVYNEEVGRVMARLQAMYESLSDTGALERFDFFVLSDTTRPDTWVAEEAALIEVRRRTGGHARIFYRHRYPNEGRKAGNIADWVRRFGADFAHMVVLDADSLMTGETLVRLAAEMERRDDLGLVQTLPVIVNASTIFARLQQFANRLYGPLLGHGLAWWHGSDSNYWGHNAIIRTRAFAEQAGLPALPGRKPIGGDIMSHDFVEAALMRRGGWAVEIAPEIGGSYEESPPAISDYAVRDRRWCQGNLQHIGVLHARGLHPVSRLHLLTGIAAYATAPLWLMFLLAGLLIALQAQFIRPEYFPANFLLFPEWPAQDPVRAAYVFGGTMALLFLPKLLAYLVLLGSAETRRAFGGSIRGLLSLLLETIAAGLMAPVMMLNQSLTVVAALAGRDVGWSVQRRADGVLPFSEVVRGYLWHTLFGLMLAAAAYAVSWSLFLWMSPVILGLLLAIPLATLTASAGLGHRLKRLGLLRVPEEVLPPPILARANELSEGMVSAFSDKDAASQLVRDEELAAVHVEQLRPRRRHYFDPDLAVALFKLDEAESPQQLREMLSDRELSAVLSDPQGFGRLMDALRG